MTEYPESEKLHEVAGKSQAIGEFVDWLRETGWHIDRPRKVVGRVQCFGAGPYSCESGRRVNPVGTVLGTCRACNGIGMVDQEYTTIDHLDLQEKLAEFFEIDLVKLEAEKRAMLAEFRRLTEQTQT